MENSDCQNLNISSTLPKVQGIWPDVQIAPVGGVPMLNFNGQPWFGWGANRPIYGDHYEAFERLAGVGLRQFHCDATCAEDLYHPEIRFWHGPGQFDGSALDRHFSRLAAIDETALFQLRIAVYAPDWWLDAHPDHCQVYSDGRIQHELQRAGNRRLPSLASPLWRKEACEAMEQFILWLIDSGWSRRVSALFICGGITWEWALLGSDAYLDYSSHGQQYFRDYQQRKYGHIKHSVIPSAERRGAPGGAFGVRPRPVDQDVIDHQQSLSEMNVDFLLELAATAKRTSGRSALVGTFYGYTLTAREHTAFTGQYGAGGFQGGHHALGRVLRSPDIDFLASPFNYVNRELGSGLLYEHIPLASVHAHGKAFFDENDLYAFNNPQETDDRAASISVGFTKTAEETLAIFRAAFGQAIVRGKHQWLTELTGWVGKFQENFSDPDLLAEIQRLNRNADELLLQDRSPVSEIVFVLDEKSIAHLTLDNKEFLRLAYQASVWWGHTGAPFELLLLDDLLELKDTRHLLVIPICIKAPESLEQLDSWNAGRQILAETPESLDELVTLMSTRGVHRYVSDNSTVWANASMVFVHVEAPASRTITFRQPCCGREIFSGRSFDAASGHCDWDFAKNDSALFCIQKL
jgi:hypothetical protein